MTMTTETRNVIDHYHYWKHDAIVADLDSRRHPFQVLCSNLYNDFNIATVIRNANAFLASKVILYGNKRYDRRGTVGTHRYTHFQHCPNEISLREYLAAQSFDRIVGIDNVDNATPISDYDWGNGNVLLVLGQEQVGIPDELVALCDDMIYIPQYGSVRSLNVGVASGIAMYDLCSKIHT